MSSSAVKLLVRLALLSSALPMVESVVILLNILGMKPLWSAKGGHSSLQSLSLRVSCTLVDDALRHHEA